MRAAAAEASGPQSGSVRVAAPEHPGRKPQDAEEDAGSSSSDGLRWSEGSAAERPLRRFTWSQQPGRTSGAFSVSNDAGPVPSRWTEPLLRLTAAQVWLLQRSLCRWF